MSQTPALAALIVTAIAALAAAASAVVAGFELRQTRNAARLKTSLDFVHEIQNKSVAIASIIQKNVRAEIVEYYSEQRDDLSKDARAYMDHLYTLDRMLCALRLGAADKAIIRQYERDLWRPHDELLQFIVTVRSSKRGNDSILEYLLLHLREVGHKSEPNSGQKKREKGAKV